MKNKSRKNDKKRYLWTIGFFGFVMLVVTSWAISGPYPTAYISDPIYYANGNCPSSKRNVKTASGWDLRDALIADGWYTLTLSSSSARGTHFIEKAYGGQDHYYADAKDLAVFNGHGNTGRISFPYVYNGICSVNVLNPHPGTMPQVRLNSPPGWGKAGNVIYKSCCTLNFWYFILMMYNNPLDQPNNVNQMFGFHGLDINAANDHRLKRFYEQTYNGGKTNTQSWLDNMYGWGGAYVGYTSPVVASFGNNAWEATHIRDNARLRGGYYRYSTPTKKKWFLITYYDNGCSGCDVCW